MFKSLVSGLLLTPIGKFRMSSIGFILCAGFLALGIMPANAQIKVGSVVNFQNQFNLSDRRQVPTYLDTRGRVGDKKEFVDAKVSENVFVSTHASPDRDKGSGSWKIVSANTKKKDGDVLNYGDEIYLLNMYPGVGYLDVWSDKLSFYKLSNPDETDYQVFASTANNRDKGSGTWIIKKVGKLDEKSEVKQNELVMLESKRFPGHYLETNSGVIGSSNLFKEYTGSLFLVFITDTGFHSNSEKWKIILK